MTLAPNDMLGILGGERTQFEGKSCELTAAGKVAESCLPCAKLEFYLIPLKNFTINYFEKGSQSDITLLCIPSRLPLSLLRYVNTYFYASRYMPLDFCLYSKFSINYPRTYFAM